MQCKIDKADSGRWVRRSLEFPQTELHIYFDKGDIRKGILCGFCETFHPADETYDFEISFLNGKRIR